MHQARKQTNKETDRQHSAKTRQSIRSKNKERQINYNNGYTCM